MCVFSQTSHVQIHGAKRVNALTPASVKRRLSNHCRNDVGLVSDRGAPIKPIPLSDLVEVQRGFIFSYSFSLGFSLSLRFLSFSHRLQLQVAAWLPGSLAVC